MELREEEYEFLLLKHKDRFVVEEHIELIEDIVLDPKLYFMHLGSN